jgi:hypothetical protein
MLGPVEFVDRDLRGARFDRVDLRGAYRQTEPDVMAGYPEPGGSGAAMAR